MGSIRHNFRPRANQSLARGMPRRFSRYWWALWYAGAINRKRVFLDVLADEIKKYQLGFNGLGDYIGEEYAATWKDLDLELIRQGHMFPRWIQFMDLAARVAHDILRLSRKQYDRIIRVQLGCKRWSPITRIYS